MKAGSHSHLTPFIAICVGLLVCALLSPFIYAYGFIFPQGDDFDESTRAVCLFDFIGAVYEVFREWFSWSGRYTYHFLAVFFGKAAESRFWSGLVCFGVLASYAFAFWWLLSPVVSRRFYSRIHALVLSVCSLLALYASFAYLPAFYLLTDALTTAHQGATALFFLALIISLWQKVDSPASNVKNEWKRALFTGIFAIGVYEHAAIAVMCISLTAFCLAIVLHRLSHRFPGYHFTRLHIRKHGFAERWNNILDRHLGKLANPYIKPFLTLFICLLLPLTISFLAPGNFVRKISRGVDTATQIAQIKMIGHEWLNAMLAFLESPWIPLLICLVVAVRFFIKPVKKRNIKLSCLTVLAATLCFLLFSFSLVFLHALSDVPFSSHPKLAASFGFYAALTFSVILFHSLAHISFPEKLPRLVRSVCAALVLGIFMILVVNTSNFRQTFINAANGNMLLLADKMRTRNLYLQELSEARKIKLEPTGLLGEILFPGVRKRKPRPDLSDAVVESVGSPVFPVYMHEALAGTCEGWPNLWAAWIYGQGCIRARAPNSQEALAKLEDNKARLLVLSSQLAELGISRAWHTVAQGGKGSTFSNAWLVIEYNGQFSGEISLLRANPPDWLRLLPLHLQEEWQTSLLRKECLTLDWHDELVASSLVHPLKGTGYYAIAVGSTRQFANYPPALFFSFNGKDYYAIDGMEKTDK